MRRTHHITAPLLLFRAVLLATQSLAAQAPVPESPPVEIQYPSEVKLLTPRLAIHADDDPDPPGPPLTPIQKAARSRDRIFGNLLSVSLDVVINQNGRVESVHATAGPERFFAQAEDIVLHRAYAPIRVDGNVVRARFEDYVAIYPKELRSAHPTPFPANPNLSSMTLSLQRTGCLGTCPSYTVTLNGSGDITFDSAPGEGYVAVPGIHHSHITQADVLDLLNRFREASFFSARDKYQCDWTDMPSQTLTLSLNGLTKKVFDYGGSIVGLPDSIEALESAVDSATDTDRWVRGNANTLSSLQAEHWNFAGTSTQNIAFFNATIDRKDPDLLHTFLAAEAPILTTDATLVSPICTASAAGNRDLVEQMLTLHPKIKFNQLTLDECLSLSAGTGSVPLTELWLDHGARTNFPPASEDDSSDARRINPPLLSALQAGSPEVLELLLHHHASVASKDNDHRALPGFALSLAHIEDDQKLQRILSLLIDAGADINEETDNSRPAIFEVNYHPSIIPLLLKNGADPNCRDSDGGTPLIVNAGFPEAIKALLAVGADPTLKARDGTTALSEARKYHYAESAALIEAALKQRAPQTLPSATAKPSLP